MTTFIEVYENALSGRACDDFIKLFENSSDSHRVGDVEHIGYSNKVLVKQDVKKSLDMSINVNTMSVIDEWSRPLSEFLTNLEIRVNNYKNKYTWLKEYDGFVFENNSFNLQKYLPNEGFYGWHCENFFNANKRVLVFMCYLNNVDDGGTEFGHGLKNLEAKKGTIALWPPYWTHPHRGIISKTQTKYILTGWLEFYEDNDENVSGLKELCYD